MSSSFAAWVVMLVVSEFAEMLVLIAPPVPELVSQNAGSIPPSMRAAPDAQKLIPLDAVNAYEPGSVPFEILYRMLMLARPVGVDEISGLPGAWTRPVVPR